jgi:hypothetical protein
VDTAPEPEPAPKREPATPPQPPPSAEQRPAAPERRFPLSVFAEEEPTVTLRRSTLIFCIIVVLVLLFVAYSLGMRAGASPSRKPQAPATISSQHTIEHRVPALPERYRNKPAACVKVLDHTQDASEPNALAYVSFFNEADETAFLRAAQKEAFVLSHDRKLYVYVGPFEPAAVSRRGENPVLSRLRSLRYKGVRQFARVGLEVLPERGKLFRATRSP